MRNERWTTPFGLAAALLAWACASVVGMAAADDPPAAPQQTYQFLPLEQMTLPPAEYFLNTDPNSGRDWIVLKDGTVVVCLSLSPRPNTIGIRRKEIEDKQAARRGLTGDKLAKWLAELQALQAFDITVPDLEPEPEFRLPLDKIDRIIHHEDLWLQRVGTLIAEQKIEAAMELLARLEQWRSDWPGISDKTNDLVFADANLRLADGQRETALMLYEEIARRRPDYPGLAQRAGQAVDQQIAAAMAASDYRQARYFLGRLNQIAPGTPVFQTYTAQLAQRAASIMQSAREAQTAGDLAKAARLADESLRVWPDAPGLANTHKSIVDRYQQVRVGVLRLPGVPTAYPLDTAADERSKRLTQIPLFEVSAFEGGTARYRTRFFDEWMPFNLGRTIRFTLRQTRQPWESQPVLLGWPITDGLLERLDPDNPRYDERLASYVESMTVESPFEFTIGFRRAPPRLEALLTQPVVVAPPPGESEGAGPTTEPRLPAGAFAITAQTPKSATYRRYFPEPDRQRLYHIAEVQEIRFNDSEAAVAALQAGEVDMLPNPPNWIVRRILENDELKSQYFIQAHAIPETHVLQFNPRQRVLQSRELRRALIYATNRNAILEGEMLRGSAGTQGRVVAGPFPSNSRANAEGVEARPYDPYAALALALAARNSLTAAKVIDGELPRLRLLIPPDPVIRNAADQIVNDWHRIGIDAEVIPDDDLTAYAEGRWDLIYRRVQMTEPIVDLWPFLTLQPTARIDDLAPFPDWLKQEIVALDRASDYTRAEDRVRILHRHLSLEAALIPLWEIQPYTLYRKNLRGFAVSPIHCYENIDSWVREASPSAVGL